MQKNLILIVSLILSFLNSGASLKREDGIAERNAQFNAAVKGTQYELRDQSNSHETLEAKHIKDMQFKTRPYKDVKKELDKFKRAELRRIAPEKLQKKLILLEKRKLSKFDKMVWLFHGLPGSGKSSCGKLTACIAKRPYIFLESTGLGDAFKASARDFVNALFDPLIETQEEAIVVIDELTGFTDKFNNANDGDAGAVQHFWTKFDACKSNPNLLIIATLNDITKLPTPLRNRCTEFKFELPNFDSRLRIFNNYLTNNQITKKFLTNLASKTNYFGLRDLMSIIAESENSCSRRSIANPTKEQLLNEKDIQDAFETVYEEEYKSISDAKYGHWKKLIKEYAPIVFLPLLGMAINTALQQFHYHQQKTWNESCHRESIRIQEQHHKDNLALQREHFVLQIKQSNDHHQENLKIQQLHNQESLDQQLYGSLSHITGPAVCGLLVASHPILAILLGASVSIATASFPRWSPDAKRIGELYITNISKNPLQPPIITILKAAKQLSNKH